MPNEITNSALKELLEKWRSHQRAFEAVRETLSGEGDEDMAANMHMVASDAKLFADEVEAAWPRIAAMERLDELQHVHPVTSDDCGFAPDCMICFRIAVLVSAVEPKERT